MTTAEKLAAAYVAVEQMRRDVESMYARLRMLEHDLKHAVEEVVRLEKPSQASPNVCRSEAGSAR